MTTDPLSEVLSLLRPRSSVSAGFEASGDWAVRFEDQVGSIKCYAVTKGTCWLTVEGVAEAVHVRTGDCFVLASGRSFRIGSDLAVPAVPALTIFPPSKDGGVVCMNEGGSFSLVGSRFAIEGSNAAELLMALPAIIHVRGETDREMLRWSVERMRLEVGERRPGSALMARHLAHMMLVQTLRLHLLDVPTNGTGWYLALADPRIAASLTAMHAAPERRWSLADLARTAGMSRSTFSPTFLERVGQTPMTYLTRWRMLLATERLSNGERVASVAQGLGYGSESAFSTAFRKSMGYSPSTLRRSTRGLGSQ